MSETTLVFNGIRTLPLYLIVVKLKGDLPAFGKGQGDVVAPTKEDLEYKLPVIEIPSDPLNSAIAANKALDVWQQHLHKYCMRVQFDDDQNSQRYAALHRQTQLLSVYLESEHSVDTTVLITTARLALEFANVHFDYRSDERRDEDRDKYVRRLHSIWQRFSKEQQAGLLFVTRMQARLSALITKNVRADENMLQVRSTPAATPVDFVLLTALDEERDALLKLWPSAQAVPPTSDDVRFYYEGSINATHAKGSKCVYRVVLVPLLRMGRVSAALATSDAIRRWKPKYVILIGIAGGIESRGVQLGDLLISDQIVDYETQKLCEEREPDVRWNVQLADPRLLGAAKNLHVSSCLAKIAAIRPAGGVPAAHVGPIATGDKIVATADLLKQHGQVWTKLLGVEMEAGGVASAAHESTLKPGFFIVRAVSDLADANKSSPTISGWRPYACELAAAYTMTLLEGGPVPQQ